MRYYLLLPGDTEASADYDTNLLGEDTGFGIFWPGAGLQALMSMVDSKPQMLRYVIVKDEKGRELTIEEFLKQIQNLRIKR